MKQNVSKILSFASCFRGMQNYKTNLLLGFYTSVFAYNFAFQPAYAEPRANIISNAKGELLEKLKTSIGEVEGAPQSVFEARKRASLAETYAEELLRSEGFYQSNITLEISEGEKPQATIKIDTGPQFKIGEAKIIWEQSPPSNTTQTAANVAINLKRDEPARAQEVLNAEARVLGAVLSRGYANALTGAKKIIVDHETKTLNPTFVINAGEIVKFGDVIITSNTKINPKWLAKISPIKKGQNFDPNSINVFERRLLETGAFDSVSLALAPISNSNNERNLNISLQDRARFNIETEISYSTNEGVAFEGRLGRYNLLGRGDALINRLIFGQIEKRLESEWRLPHFKFPDQTLAMSLGAFQDDTKAYREKGIDGKAEITRKLGPTSFWTLGGAANVARTREPSFIDPDNGIERDYGAFNLVAAALIDRTDNSLNPKLGFKTDLRIEPTIITGDANLSYVKMVGQASYYYSFGNNARNVLATRARLGSIIGASIPELPSGRRLYAGGGGSVRGFEYQGIGPHYTDADTTPVGGLSLFEASAEYRYDFKNKFGMVAFVDTGTLGIESTPSFDEFRVGLGVGLRYDLGFAPLRIDVGFPINPPEGNRDFQLYIGVGQSF